MELLKLRVAAEMLSISYPTLKQWIYPGKLRSIKTPGGHHRIARSEIDCLTHVRLRADQSNRGHDRDRETLIVIAEAKNASSRQVGSPADHLPK